MSNGEMIMFKAAPSRLKVLARFLYALCIVPLFFSQPLLAENRDSIAVIIGNKTYESAKYNVKYAHNDADSIKAFLVQKMGFREANVTVLKDATLGKLITWFGDDNDREGRLWNWVRPGKSNVFVYYSGHGAPDTKTKLSYLIPVDLDPNQAGRGYKLALLQQNLELIKRKIGPKRQVILMLDACFSGLSSAGALQESSFGAYKPMLPTMDTSIIKLSASSATQVANWDDKSQHGLLTSLFLKGVTGAADKEDFGNKDGHVSWSEVSTYLRSEVSYISRRLYSRDQNPQISKGSDVHWKIKPGPIVEKKKPQVTDTEKPDKPQKHVRINPVPQPRLEETKLRIASFVKWDILNDGNYSHDFSPKWFASRMDYYGKRGVSQKKVVSDKRKYFRKWPRAKYTLQDDTMKIWPSGQEGFYEVQYEYTYDLSNAKKRRRGRGIANLTVKVSRTSIQIHRENGRVLKKW